MHVLDFLMYFILLGVIMYLLEVISDGQYTQGLGSLVAMIVACIYTIFYIFLFVAIDYNWIDIFRNLILNLTW